MARTDTPVDLPDLPSVPADRLTAPFRRFLRVESSGGLLLLAATAVALVFANSTLAHDWAAFWKQPVGFSFGSFSEIHGLYWWVNDALMAVFFFVVGLEIKRELVSGELADKRKVALPVAAALGGAALPALIYLMWSVGPEAADGWAVPMATDIAFVVGALALLGDRVPRGLKVLLLSVAIVDDLLAVAIIALFFGEALKWTFLVAAAAGLALHVLLVRLGVRSIGVFALVGIVVWWLTLQGGIHPTVAGVFLGLLTPLSTSVSRDHAVETLARGASALQDDGVPDRAVLQRVEATAREAMPMGQRLEDALHPWSAFMIMPVFALANAGVSLSADRLMEPVSIAVASGLVVGKPVGLFAAAFLTVRLGLGRLPGGVSWPMLLGGGMLAGIGFTMALFIAALAFEGGVLDAARTGILAGSAVSGVAGYAVLRWAGRSE